MPIEVELPNGYIAQFPDGTPRDTIQAAIQKAMGGKRYPNTMSGPPIDPPQRTPLEKPPTLLETIEAGAAGAGKGAFNVGGLVQTPEQQEASMRKNPLAAGAGYVGAGMAAGGAATRAMQAIPGVAPVAGQVVRNAARYVLPGAVVGGTQAASEGEDPRAGAALGTLGAVAAPIMKAGAKLGRWAAGFADGRVRSAVRVISNRLRMTPDELVTKLDEYERATGRQLTMSEILDPRSGAEFQILGKNKEPVGDAFRANEQRVMAERPGAMRTQIERGGTGTIARLDQLQDEAADKLMGQIGKSTVAIPPAPPSGPDPVAPELRRRLAEVTDSLSRRGIPGPKQLLENGEIDLRTLDLVRRDINKLVRSEPGKGHDHLRDEVTALATKAHPKYAGFLREFGARERQIAGMEAGQAGTRSANLRGPERQDAGTVEYRVGQSGGTRNRLSAAAGSERGAVNTADKLRQSPPEVAEVLGPQETARLASTGRAETETAERLKQLNSPIEAASKKAERLAQMAIEGAAVGTGGVLSGFAVHWTRRLMLEVADRTITPATAKQVARLMTDPTTTRQGIQMLRQAGVSQAKIDAMIQAVSAGVGQSAGGSAQ